MVDISAFAPALEHSHRSNQKEDDWPYSHNLEQHHDSLCLAVILPGCVMFRSDTDHAADQGPIYGYFPDSSGWFSSSDRYPRHCSTGRRGYLGNMASVKDSWHM